MVETEVLQIKKKKDLVNLKGVFHFKQNAGENL